MASLKSIRKRINSVKNTRQITKAMKMVAAAKLRRAQESVLAARPYAEKLGEVLRRLAVSGGEGAGPLTRRERRDSGERALLIVVSSDRGLCGGFNANISKAAEAFIRENNSRYSEISLVTIGRKSHEYLRSRADIRKNYANVMSTLNYQTAALIAQELIDGFLADEYDEVFLLYNAFKSVLTQTITLKQLLPIGADEGTGDGTEEHGGLEAIYEPSREELLTELFPKHIEVQLFHAMLESLASEHGARMTAMDSATKNANEMIGKLTLQYNRARQAAITTELMEIISGAESIKG